MSDASRVKTIARLIALAVGAMLMPSMAPAATVDDVKGAAAVVAAAKKHKTVRVIARLANPAGTGMSMAAAAIGQQAGSLTRAMAAVGGSKLSPIKGLPLGVLRTDASQLGALIHSGLVEAVQEDKPARPALAQSVPLIDAPAAWNATPPARGAGWAVAILDTGVQTNHPFLAGRTVAEACFSTSSYPSSSLCPNGQDTQTGTGAGVNCSPALPGCLHGTEVAGIAAGRNYSGGPGFNGVAPDASIISVQVSSQFVDDYDYG